jgi:hypothetical protein
MKGLGGGPNNLVLPSSPDVQVQRSFSNKLVDANGQMRDYTDFFEKIEHYVRLISGPAIEKYKRSPYTFRLVEENPTESVFKFRDTLTSRAQIVDLSSKFANDVVAVIGLGGTGSYVLDFLVKMPIKEIRGFDFVLRVGLQRMTNIPNWARTRPMSTDLATRIFAMDFGLNRNISMPTH